MKIHDQTLASATTSSIIHTDNGQLALAILDDPTSPQSHAPQLILTTSAPTATATASSSLSPSSPNILLATSSLSRLDHLQISNGSVIHSDAGHSGSATSTTTNVIVQANGSGTVLIQSPSGNQLHQHGNSSASANVSTVLVSSGTASIEQCPATTSTVVTSIPVTTVTGTGIENGTEILQIITPESQANCYTDGSLTIDIKDGIFDDESDGEYKQTFVYSPSFDRFCSSTIAAAVAIIVVVYHRPSDLEFEAARISRIFR